MRLLVTGGCGFIASNYVNYLLKEHDHYVVNLDAMYYCASEENIEDRENPNYKFYRGSVTDLDLVKKILLEEKIETIIHFAAQSHVDTSFVDSLIYTEDNVKGTHTLLEAVRQVDKNILFLHFSTDEVYGESGREEDAKTEKSVLSPTNPYAASKAAAEMYVNAYSHSFGIRTIITRCNNVYGKNQYPEKMIPKFIQLVKEGKKCTIHGRGETMRSFIHVDDVSRAVDVILHKGVPGEIYNIPSTEENEKTVLEVARIIIEKLRPAEAFEDWITFVEDRPFNDLRYYMNGDKLKNLGWHQQRTTFDISDLL